MTADLTPSLAEQKAAEAHDRKHILAQLDAAKPTVKGRWRVYRQFSHLPDALTCGHRFELLAELCAYRRTRSHTTETGAHYTVRRADA